MNSTPGTSDHSLVKRVVVILIFAPLLVWLCWTGGFPLFIFLAFLTAFGQWELYHMLEHRLRFPHRVVGFIGGMLIILGAFFGYYHHSASVIVAALLFSFIIEIVSGKEHKLEAVVLALFVTVYPAFFILYLVKLSGFRYQMDFAYGRYVLLYTLLLVWTLDIASYCAGRLWGRRKFFPGISPKKTIEGFVGGIFAVVILSLAAGILMGNSYIHLIVLSVLAAIAGQAGDLSESIIKRDRGVKDSSNIIPGHGGILDRFDSLFFAAPVVYYYLLVVMHFSGGRF